MTSEAPARDGRHRRSQRSRERILDAVARALESPEIEVTAERVAAEAGVSLSTIFRHFGDMQGLSAAMTARLEARLRAILLRGPYAGPLRARIADLVDRRCQAAEVSRPLRRAALRAVRPTADARERDAAGRRILRAQIVEAFAGELEEASADRLAALDTLLSFESVDHLRVHQGLALPRAAQTLEAAARALLSG